MLWHVSPSGDTWKMLETINMKACCEIRANLIVKEGKAICKECGEEHRIFS